VKTEKTVCAVVNVVFGVWNSSDCRVSVQ
jgi:hypothetical protein